jgi:hypothetical protein
LLVLSRRGAEHPAIPAIPAAASSAAYQTMSAEADTVPLET